MTKFEQYLEDLNKDIELKEVNLHEKSLTAPAIKVKWIRILHEERTLFKNLKKAEKTAIDQFVSQNTAKPRMQHEFEISKNEKMVALRAKIEEQEQLVGFLQDIVNVVISQYGYDVSSVVKLISIEQR